MRILFYYAIFFNKQGHSAETVLENILFWHNYN